VLVLARKVNEKILIGENITIMPVRISGNTVRIGIEAPREILVLREELLAPADPLAHASEIELVASDGREFVETSELVSAPF